MDDSRKPKDGLKRIPAVGIVMNWPEIARLSPTHGRAHVLKCVRDVLSESRSSISKTGAPMAGREELAKAIRGRLAAEARPNLVAVINATGVLLHTNLGRAPLSDAAVSAVRDIAANYSNLEYRLDEGRRGSRHDLIAGLLLEIIQAPAAMAVNNNAAAVMLALNTHAEGREVVISRGELIEIGGSFRLPEIIRKSGCRLVEVGTTNKTRARDYLEAVSTDTALFLKAHQSNFRMEGFVSEVSEKELAEIGKSLGIPVVSDLGSGLLIDGALANLAGEPPVQKAIEAGCRLVTFSGDKLLGGPQAGIIAGDKDMVEACMSNPLARALRVDKMTLAALEATLTAYRDPLKAIADIPILRAAAMPASRIKSRAARLAARLRRAAGEAEFSVVATKGRVGGGAMPLYDLPGFAVAVKARDMSSDNLEEALRKGYPPIIARIEGGRVLIEVRSLLDGQEQVVENRLKSLFERSREA